MNIVFDLGGVVVSWRPDEVIAQFFIDPDERLRVWQQVLMHADWLALDRGTLPRAEAVSRGAARAAVDAATLAALFRDFPAALIPMPDTVALMRRLHAAGQPLYCLSNMHVAAIEHLEASHDFFEVFRGRVISCRVKTIKPEPAIYAHLLASYELNATDTVFIDDLQENLDAAAAFGMQTIRFTSAAQCEKELRGFGCI